MSNEIHKLAKRIAPDYPFSDNPSVNECVWAIESAWLGVNSANKDWQEFGQRVMKKYNPSGEEIKELFYGKEK